MHSAELLWITLFCYFLPITFLQTQPLTRDKVTFNIWPVNSTTNACSICGPIDVTGIMSYTDDRNYTLLNFGPDGGPSVCNLKSNVTIELIVKKKGATSSDGIHTQVFGSMTYNGQPEGDRCWITSVEDPNQIKLQIAFAGACPDFSDTSNCRVTNDTLSQVLTTKGKASPKTPSNGKIVIRIVILSLVILFSLLITLILLYILVYYFRMKKKQESQNTQQEERLTRNWY